jgi:hypothetical protein
MFKESELYTLIHFLKFTAAISKVLRYHGLPDK